MAGKAVKSIAVIPARGGSKRLPRKNILPVNGSPIISYPIRAAQQSGLFDDVIVSTEDAEIAEISSSYNATVSQRPMSLAEDQSTVVQVCAELLSRDDYQMVDLFCCIYATAFLVTPDDLVKSCSILDGGSDIDYVMGVSEYNYSPVKALREKDGYLGSMWPEYSSMQSQLYPALVVSNGTIYWARRNAFMKDLSFYGEKLRGYKISNDRVIDIDTVDDYRRAIEMAGK